MHSNRSRNAAEATPVAFASAILTCDADGTIAGISERARLLLGRDSHELLGQNFTELEAALPKGRLAIIAEPFPLKDGATGTLVTLRPDTDVVSPVVPPQHATDILADAVNSTSDALFVKDLAGTYLAANTAYGRLLGRPIDRIVGKTDAELFDIGVATVARFHDQQVIAGCCSVTNDRLFWRRDGSAPRLVVVTEDPYRDSDGAIVGVIGACTDITDRDRSDVTERVVAHSARCLIWYADVRDCGVAELDWKIRVLSEPAAVEFLPILIEPGQDYATALLRGRIANGGAHIASIANEWVRAGKSYIQEYRVRTQDGQLHWLREDVSVESVGPNAWRLVGVCTDITDRKRAEELQRVVMRSARCLLWYADVEDVENVFGEALTWHTRVLSEETAHEFLPLYKHETWTYADALFESRLPEDNERMHRHAAEQIRANRSYSQEYRVRTQDGDIRWLQEDVSVERIQPGRWQVVGVCTDITDRKRSEDVQLAVTHSARCLLWCADVHDVDGERLDWIGHVLSDEVARDFLPIAVLPGQSYFNAIYFSRLEEDDARMEEFANRHVRANKSYSQEYRIMTRDGELRWLQEDIYIEPIDIGRWRAVGVSVDVTERKRAEEAQRAIMRSARCLIWLADVAARPGGGEFDLDWDIHAFSEESAQEFLPLEIPNDQDYWQTLAATRLMEDATRIHQYGAACIRAGIDYSQEFRCPNKNGDIRWLHEEVHVEAIGYERWRCVGVCTDVTELKQIEESMSPKEDASSPRERSVATR